ncbi:hypothetical protein AMR41_30340 [Hapalosiphon sp. MRB220]|nr:hypothetical protein AMR41_30340 [Hapalosiphon sp. MRB220]
MNILIVTDYQIYPFKIGASVAQFGTIEYLSKLCNLSLLLSEQQPITEQELSELKELLPNVKIYTTEDSTKSSNRIHKNNNNNYFINLLYLFHNLERKSIDFTKKKLKNIIESKQLQKKLPEEDFADVYTNYNPFYIHSKQYIDAIKTIIIEDHIDIVQLEFIETLNLVTILPSNVKKLFIQHEPRFIRISSHIDAKQIQSNFTNYIYNFNKCIELSLLENFDGILSFNNSDCLALKEALDEKGKHIQFFTSPFPILDQDFRPIDKKTFRRPNKLTFIGPEQHFPNKDAVEWFIEEVAVEIYSKYGLKLYVIGQWSLETIEKYKNHPSGVTFLGFVEDVYEVCKDSISIAPVRIGGGLRTKIMLAMAQGIPVISTKFALEGIHAKHLESVMIAENKDSFCRAVEYILSDLERTVLMCENAQNLMRKYYSQSVVSDIRYECYKSLLKEVSLLK